MQTGQRIAGAGSPISPHPRIARINRNEKDEDVYLDQYLEDIHNHEIKAVKEKRPKPNFKSPYSMRMIRAHSQNDLRSLDFLKNYLKDFDKNDQKNIELDSPYLQNFRNTNLANDVLIPRVNSERKIDPNLRSSSRGFGYRSSSRLTFDNNATNRTNRTTNRMISAYNFGSSLRNRPSSAPIRSGSKSARRRVLKQPNLLKSLAYRNGNRQFYSFIAARSLKEFLEIATDRLKLPRAARRLFFENGDEIKEESDFVQNDVVYVSCGEEFQDPHNETNQLIERRKNSVWTAFGIQFSKENSDELAASENEENEEKEFNATKNRKKSIRLINTVKATRRLLVLENGKGGDAVQVVFEVNNSADEIDEESKENLSRFLAECSSRLRLNVPARLVFNWYGERVKSIDDVPRLDKCLQIVHKVEFAPVWISKGEGFDPYGAYIFTKNLLNFAKSYLKETVRKIKSIEKKLDELKREKLKTKAIQAQIDEAEKDLKEAQQVKEEFKPAVEKLEELVKPLEQVNKEQNENGFQSLFAHIKEVKLEQGARGIKVKVFVNGTDRSFDVLLSYKVAKLYDHALFDICNGYRKYDKFNYIKFTRIFNESGVELKPDDFKLYNNQVIYVSSGENWIDPSKIDVTYVVSVRTSMLLPVRNETAESNKYEESEQTINGYVDYSLDTNAADFFKKKDKKSLENNERNFKTFQTSHVRLEVVEKYKKPEQWSVLDTDEALECFEELAEKRSDAALEDCAEVNFDKATQAVLRCKLEPSILVHPTVSVEAKINDKETLVWNSLFQHWKFTQNGLIYNKFFPKLCLEVKNSCEIKIEIYFNEKRNESLVGKKHEDQEPTPKPYIKTAYLVQLGCKKLNENEQKWQFNKFGQIVSKSNNQNLVLTSVDLLRQKLTNLAQNKNLLEKFEIKTESESEVGDLSLLVVEAFGAQTLENKTWVKVMKELAKSQHWAIKQESLQAKSNREWKLSKLGTLSWLRLCYTWPVDEDEKLIEDFSWPLSGCLVAGAPCLKTLVELENSENEEIKLRVFKNGNSDFSVPICLTRSFDLKKKMHCMDVTYSEFDLSAFLSSCTSALNLPKAARRLFDEKGNECEHLLNLKNEQVVFVSMGEAWVDPNSVREELERKRLLTNLASDLEKIAFYIRLRNCLNYVAEVDKLKESSRVVLGESCLIEGQIDEGTISAPKNNDLTDSLNNEFQNKFWPTPKMKNSKLSSQRFAFNSSSGFIFSVDNPNLVFGVEEIDTNLIEVVLLRRNEDNALQRWSLNSSGTISLRARPSLVLSVRMPALENTSIELNVSEEELMHSMKKPLMNEAGLVLQPEIETDYGNAHQKWYFDEQIGCIYAFAALNDPKKSNNHYQTCLGVIRLNKLKSCI